MPEKLSPPSPTSAAARLRHAIDSGNTGDKVNYPDPAAAPLGTDDEAAGTTPALTEREIDAELIRTPRNQRSWIRESLGERSAKIVVLAFLLALALVTGWIVSGHNA
ncbi:MAG: hypothetical protein C0456_02910 [Hyphomonas sp.]|uniref:hypothetical protein n=1 Tax=Hyphomonas sp. TaxID=87 RepID=UPI001D20DDF3|nr:hypothetical protein [Hyphomonas sp.]MBA4225557.1 hypothetical protein [Hyphomonas sp.]